MTPARARALYTLLWRLGLPLVAAYLLWRSLRQPEYRQHWAERFGGTGALPAPDDGGPVIWVHAVSVGETRAAQPLVEALAQAWPGCRFVLTHMTPTGRAVGRQLAAAQGSRLVQRYLPYELPGALARFFDETRPVLGLIMETEVWPNLLHEARARGVPVALVNARLSDQSLARALRLEPLLREAARGITEVLAQTAADAGRLRRLYDGPVEVVGNLKFDLLPPLSQIEDGRRLRAGLGAGPQRPIWLAASTRDGEEAMLLDALNEELGKKLGSKKLGSDPDFSARKLDERADPLEQTRETSGSEKLGSGGKLGSDPSDCPSDWGGMHAEQPDSGANDPDRAVFGANPSDRQFSPLLVIVPRHPQRFDEVARLAQARGFRVLRRSRDPWAAPPAAGTVLLGDSMGELALYYGMADVTLMGGSFGPFGSQNLIESCSCGTPVVIGPSTYNFSLAAAQAIEAGAALQVSHAQGAIRALCDMAHQPPQLARMRAAAQAFAAAHRGATAATVDRVLRLARQARSAAAAPGA
jgi:3-deoxy-D-manno-octulosonic-acid transferase